MKKLFGVLFITLAMVAAGSFLFAEDAIVTFVSGKVEVNRNSQWIALKPGDTFSQSEMISTGFQSEAKVKLMDSILYLGPLTRVTLEQLTSTQKTDKVSVYLKTGSVRSQVNHTESKRVNYQVHTAVAVASARGTDYALFDNNEAACIVGQIAVAAYEPEVVEAESAEAADEAEADPESEGEGSATDTVSNGNSAGSAEEDSGALPDGVLVAANQSAKVSSGSKVSAPVNTVVQNANNIVQAVSTAASKESVQSSSAASSSAVTVTQNSAPETGNIEIIINVE